jgi:hypothetical protein
MRMIAACMSSLVSMSQAAASPASSVPTMRYVPKSPTTVDILSDTTDAVRSVGSVDVPDAHVSNTAASSNHQVKRQLAFVESDSLATVSSPPRATGVAVALSEDCFNDDGSPIALATRGAEISDETHQPDQEDQIISLQQGSNYRSHQQQQHQQQQHEQQQHEQQYQEQQQQSPPQLQLEQHEQQEQQHSRLSPGNSPSSSKAVTHTLSDSAVSVSPSAPPCTAFENAAPSASPLPPLSEILDSSGPFFPEGLRLQNASSPNNSRRRQQHQQQQPHQQQQQEHRYHHQQMSTNHQALIDEAVQAARLQVISRSFSPCLRCNPCLTPDTIQSAVAEECMQRARDLHAQLLLSERANVQLQVRLQDVALCA